MAITHSADLVSGREDYEIRKIGFEDLRISLRQGWEDFQAKRGDLVFIGLIYPVVVLFSVLRPGAEKSMVTLAVSVVSFPMIIDKKVSWGNALRTSVRVTRENPVTVATWGLIVVTLLILGAIPGLVGLAVVLPVLGYATWHLYTRAVVR